MQNNHEFDFDDVKIIDRLYSGHAGLKARHSIREPNSINEQMHILDSDKILVKWVLAFLKNTSFTSGRRFFSYCRRQQLVTVF